MSEREITKPGLSLGEKGEKGVPVAKTPVDHAVSAAFLEKLHADLKTLLDAFFQNLRLRPGALVVVGCTSSEILGKRIGSTSSSAVGKVVFEEISARFQREGVRLAAQCCEHLNRALVVERPVAEERGYAEVNVRPWLKGGGSFATAAFEGFKDPCVVEEVSAEAGLDIGETMIGMHLRAVAVPLKLEQRWLASARVNAARTRPKNIGGSRARYREELG